MSGVSHAQDLGNLGGLVVKKEKESKTSSSGKTGKPSKPPKQSGGKPNSNKPSPNKPNNKPPQSEEPLTDLAVWSYRLACGTKDKISDSVRRTSFERSYLEGVGARQAREYRKGETALLDAIAYKCDVGAYQELGKLYSEEQRWTQAEIAYRGALAMEPNNAKTMVLLSNVLTRPTIIPGLSEGNRYADAVQKRSEEAVKLANSALAGVANSKDLKLRMEANLQMGEALEESGDISNATLGWYKRAVTINPKSGEAYAHLGRLLKKNGRVREANDALKSAIDLAKDGPSKIVVAEILQSFGQYSESEQLLRDALSNDAANPLGLQLLGKALVKQQKYKEAEAVLKKGADFNLESIVPYISLGRFYVQQARFAEAEAALNRAVELALPSERPAIAQQFRGLAEAYGRAGRSEDADRLEKQAKTIESATGKKA